MDKGSYKHPDIVLLVQGWKKSGAKPAAMQSP